MRDRPDRTSVLKEATFPVLFIAGKTDQAVPLEKVLQQVALPQKSQAVFLGNAAHMGMFEEQEETITVIEQFADRIFGTIRI
ncbi:MAG: alpha/beta hydrolase [Sphingobacteriales bacterium]|nr:MAG: alpha/beta hydrolase [Sphingobacteriales bacterium]